MATYTPLYVFILVVIVTPLFPSVLLLSMPQFPHILLAIKMPVFLPFVLESYQPHPDYNRLYTCRSSFLKIWL